MKFKLFHLILSLVTLAFKEYIYIYIVLDFQINWLLYAGDQLYFQSISTLSNKESGAKIIYVSKEGNRGAVYLQGTCFSVSEMALYLCK